MIFAALTLALALQETPPLKPENTPENLKQIFERLQKAGSSGDEKTALALTNSLLPDEAALRKALKDGTAPETIAQVTAFWAKVTPAEPAKRAKLFAADPAGTEVRVHASTTEELSKYENGSTAFMQFPGGAKKLADTVLRPGTTWYEVVLERPGAQSGTKFHLFYWTGERWATLGPLWRAIK
ncbi:MAG: hypothetical protein HY293_05215 [Planctomycetes bacterium]|nr:hypothetical protein [Planctomycetota bacterium]